MIRYIRHNHIDRARWDECIRSSVNPRIYAYSWYLDIVSPGWDGLADEHWMSVFPLTHRTKRGISYLYQPFFTQQLGLFSRVPLTGSLLDDFLTAIPSKFRFVEIHLNSLNRPDPLRYQLQERSNHELDLNATYETLLSGYSQNTKRNIQKAKESGVTIGRKIEVDELIILFRENFGKKENKLQFRDYAILRKLLVHSMEEGLGKITGAFSSDGSLSAAAFFLKDSDRVYFLFAASAPEARENGAMFLLVDHFIRENALQPLTLDFEGGNDPGVGRFYKSFGAKEIPYCQLKIDRLFWPVKKYINLVRRFSGRKKAILL